MKDISIREASPDDLGKICQLLVSAELPTIGVSEHIKDFLVAHQDGSIVGAIGLEHYGQAALLRSAVVDASERQYGIGSTLFDACFQKARGLGIRSLYLLTNTAEQFFHKKGFRRIDRADVPEAVASSVEFTDACPSHAACMKLDLVPHVLIICTGNSCRSQMAEGWLQHFGGTKIKASSAGTHPSFVHPVAIEVMREAGLDISHQSSKSVNDFMRAPIDHVVTVCDHARETCPVIPGRHTTEHIPFDDPAEFAGPREEQLEEFRRIRDLIRNEMKELSRRVLKGEAG